MTGPRDAVATFRWSLALFIAFALAVMAIGYALWSAERRAQLRNVESTLVVVSHLKVREISVWVAERRSDAKVLGQDLTIDGDVETWLRAGAPQDERARHLRQRLLTLMAYDSYRDVALADTKGRILLSLGALPRPADPDLAAMIRRVAETGQLQFSNAHPDPARPGDTDIHIAAPALASDGGGRVVAVAVLTVDPTLGLFPLVESWPGASGSAETLIVARDGDKVVWISRPRRAPAHKGPLRQPLSDGLPAAAAATGVERVMTGLDYSGVRVIAATASIPGTTWGLVSKIDLDEASAASNRLAMIMSLVVTWLVTSTGLLLTSAWRRQQAVQDARGARAESEWLKLQQRFESLSKYANDIILLTDGDGRIVEANDRALSAYGYAHEELVGRPVAELHAAGSREDDRGDGGDTDGGVVFESLHRRRDGSEFPVEISARRLILDGERWRQLIIRDITERQRIEAEAAASAAVLRAEMELSPDGILVEDETHRWVSFNQRVLDMWSIPEVMIRTMDQDAALAWVHDQLVDAEGFLQQTNYLEEHPLESGHEVMALKDGRTFERHSSPLVLAPGKVSGRVWFFRDITERVKGSEEKARLASIVEASQDAILSMDLEGKVITWNPGAERLFGYPAEEMIGQNIRAIVPDERQVELEMLGQRLARGRGLSWLDTERVTRDGSVINVSIVASPIRAETGETIAISAIVRDISERKRAEQALQRTVRALNTLSRANVTLVRASSIEGLYQRMCDLIVEQGGYRMAWIGLAENDADRSVRPVAVAGHDEGYVSGLKLSWADNERGRGPGGSAIREGATCVNHASDQNPQMGPWREAALSRGYLSSISLPLRDALAVFGVLTIYAAESDAFGSEEIRLLEELASDIAFGVVTLGDRQARDRLAAIVESSRDAIVGKALDGTITSWNQGAANVYGYAAGEAIGRNIRFVIPQERHAEVDWILARIARGEDVRSLETERVKKDGSRIIVDLVVSPTRDLTGKVIGASAIARDVTDQKRIEQDLVRAARFDSLTGLPNRWSFVEALERAIADARRWGRNFAVLFLDLDHFKDINDTLGHPVGDQLLQGVGERLRETLRDTDTVARFGGDEFAVISTDVHEPAGVAILAERLLTAVNRPFSINGNDVRSGTSVGIAVFGPDAPDAETVLSYADIALYRAKSEGRGTFRFFTEAMDREVRRRVTLGAELRSAIESGDLFLLYQPQVDAGTGRIIGLESLVRWRHKGRGVVCPAEFIPIAEQIGLAVGLGRWVMNEACRQIRDWLDAGLEPPQVAINLSGQQFRTQGELESDLAQALRANALTPDRLELELTETVLMEASLEHSRTLLRLRQGGFAIAIDDFGTGYSSLDYLRRFPVDRIKIDQNFVKDLGATPGNEAIVKATIGLARALNLRVVAEGVETREQGSLLRSWGCEEMQGYYFAFPLSASEATAVLSDGAILPRAPLRLPGAPV